MSRFTPLILVLAASCTGIDWPGSEYSHNPHLAEMPRHGETVSREIPAAEEPDWTPSSLTVGTAMKDAWDNHPSMKRARAMVRAYDGQRLQAGLWPNPRLSVTNFNEPDIKRVTTAEIAQKLELGGKVEARISKAEAEIYLSHDRLVEAWADVRAEIKEAFSRYGYAQRRLGIAERMAAIDRESLDLTASLFKVGKIPEMEHLLIVRREGESRTVLGQARALAEDTGRQVYVATGRTPPEKLPVFSGPIEVKSPLAEDFDNLLAMARKRSPELATSKTNIAVARADYRLAGTKKWSDVTVGLGVRSAYYENGEGNSNVMTVRVAFDLPVWNRYQGDVAAARARIDAAEAARKVAVVEVAGRISDQFAVRKKWLDEKRILVDTILPAAKRQLVLVEDGFQRGKNSKLDVLKYRRDLEVLKLRLLQVQLYEAISTIQLERIAGSTLKIN